MGQGQFEDIVNELLYYIDDAPGSHGDALRWLAEKHSDEPEIKQLCLGLENSLAGIRIVIKYLMLDLDITRRERDKAIGKLEETND